MSVPRTTPDDQNQPRWGLGPPRHPEKTLCVFGDSQALPKELPGPPPGTPKDPAGTSRGIPGTSDALPGTPKSTPESQRTP